MILKIYIRKKLFHLPRNQEDLTEMIKEEFYKRKPLVKSGFAKLYNITDIENKKISYEKNTNIFLINLYLLVLEFKGILASVEDNEFELSDINIKTEISNILNEDIQALSIEELEERVSNFITNNPIKNSNNESVKVSFNMEWVKAMDKKIKE